MARKQIPNLWNMEERENVRSRQTSSDFRNADALTATKCHRYEGSEWSSNGLADKDVTGPADIQSSPQGRRERGRGRREMLREPTFTLQNPTLCSQRSQKQHRLIRGIKEIQKIKGSDNAGLPGGPVAQTPHFQGRGPRFNPWSGNQIPHAPTKDPLCHNEDPVQSNK